MGSLSLESLFVLSQLSGKKNLVENISFLNFFFFKELGCHDICFLQYMVCLTTAH